MSYNAETAKEPLTGEGYDILILQERERGCTRIERSV